MYTKEMIPLNCIIQMVAKDKALFSISCVLVLVCVPLRFLHVNKVEQVLVAVVAPCAWTILLFFARQVYHSARPTIIICSRIIVLADKINLVVFPLIYSSLFTVKVAEETA